MKAVVLRKHGKPSVLIPSPARDPRPEPDQVVVRLRSIGLNWAEILSRKGLYSWAPPLPYIIGMEAYGEIESVGTAAGHRRAGEKVIVVAQHGCYAERVAVPETQALPALESYSPEENAAFAVNYMTAWVSWFEMARLRPSDRVLVQAAGGGVGTAAVQLAKHFGCPVIGTAGSDDKLERLRRMGVDQVINYRREDLRREIERRWGARSVDVVLELVCGDAFARALGTLAPFGRVVIAGYAGLNLEKWNPLSWWRTWRDMPRVDIRRMATGSCGVMATHLGYLMDEPARLKATWEQLTSFVTKHGIRPVVGSTFSFDEIAQAHAFMESRGSFGKTVIRV